MSEFAVNGIGTEKVYNGCFAPPGKRNVPQDALKTIVNEIKRERARIEAKEIEEIRQKPAEERTFDERVKLAAYNLDKAAEFLDKFNPVVYVA